jgi:hypothetical protein
MTTPAQFPTITGSDWAAALPKARERRSGQAKRIADAVAAARLREKPTTIPANAQKKNVR